MRLTFDDYILDIARRELWCGSEPIVVEPQVFDLLVYPVQHPERVVAEDELLQAVPDWPHRVRGAEIRVSRVGSSRARKVFRLTQNKCSSG